MEVFRLDLSLIRGRSDLSDAYRKMLSDDEKEKLSRLSDPQKQEEFLGGHALIHEAVGLLHHCSPSAVKVRLRGDVPIIENAPFFVSVSHSGGLVAVAVDENPVGLDIERSFVRRNLSAIVERCFGTESAHAYHVLKPSERRAFFFRLWTMKEAGIKWQSLSSLAEGEKSETPSILDRNFRPPLHFFSGQIDDMFFSVASAKPLVSVPFIAKVPTEPKELLLPPTETLLV